MLRRSDKRRGWCEKCSTDTTLATVEEAAATMRVSVGIILAWCETGRLHLSNTVAGSPLVCFGAFRAWD